MTNKSIALAPRSHQLAARIANNYRDRPEKIIHV